MGPCTANARRPTVDSRCRGTTISCRGKGGNVTSARWQVTLCDPIRHVSYEKVKFVSDKFRHCFCLMTSSNLNVGSA